MNDQLLLYAGIMLFGVFISSLSQVALKKSADKTYSSRIREYLNPQVLIAYLVFFLATLCTVYAYRVVPLSMGPLLESSSYLFVSIFGWLFFHERLTRRKVLALLLIVAGIAVYTIF